MVQESAEWAPTGPSPTILSEAPTSRAEGALCPHSGPLGTWGAVCFGGDPCWNQSKKTHLTQIQIGKGGGWGLRNFWFLREVDVV